jgi:serine protease AprX
MDVCCDPRACTQRAELSKRLRPAPLHPDLLADTSPPALSRGYLARMQSARRSSQALGLTLLFVVSAAPLPRAQDDAPLTTLPLAQQKLDFGLAAGEQRHAVFVRFEEQLFRSAEDFPKWCEEHQDAKRLPLRKQVIAQLRKANDAAWTKLQESYSDWQKLRNVQRYWVVNGFACIATGDQCVALTRLEEVAFIYRQPQRRLPALHAQRPATGRNRRQTQEQVEQQEARLVERALKELEQRGEEHPLDPDSVTVPFNVARIGAPQAWKKGAQGQGITVALLDTGLLPTPALLRALWRNDKEQLNGKDDDGNGYVDDLFGYDFARQRGISIGDGGRCHGSMCGGIVAGREVDFDNQRYVTGVAPRARLMVLRGMGQLLAYEYALLSGADVVSMSYMWVNVELGNWRGIYRLAHEHMTAAGIVSVGGAGNFQQRAPEGKQIALPKDIPCVIAAAGLDQTEALPSFSSLGPVSWMGVRFYDDHWPETPLIKPDVTAFSMDFPVWTLLRAWPERSRRTEHVHDAGNGIGLVIGARGNSFAGPHAAGVAALMLSKNPELPAWRVKELMEASCQDLGEDGKDTSFGAGLLRAASAVRAAAQARSEG